MIKAKKYYNVAEEFNKILNKNEKDSNMKLGYVLYDTKNKHKMFVGKVIKDDVINNVLNKTDKELDKVLKVHFNSINKMFKKLNNKYDIAYIDNKLNKDIWILVNGLSKEEINLNYKSLKKYMKYCKENKINVSKDTKNEIPDIMKKLSILEEKCL